MQIFVVCLFFQDKAATNTRHQSYSLIEIASTGHCSCVRSAGRGTHRRLKEPCQNQIPAQRTKYVIVPLVALTIALYFVLPELRIGFGQYILLTTFVSMPETAVDEYSRSIFAHDYIRFTRNTLDILSIPVSMHPQTYSGTGTQGCLEKGMQ